MPLWSVLLTPPGYDGTSSMNEKAKYYNSRAKQRQQQKKHFYYDYRERSPEPYLIPQTKWLNIQLPLQAQQ